MCGRLLVRLGRFILDVHSRRAVTVIEDWPPCSRSRAVSRSACARASGRQPGLRRWGDEARCILCGARGSPGSPGRPAGIRCPGAPAADAAPSGARGRRRSLSASRSGTPSLRLPALSGVWWMCASPRPRRPRLLLRFGDRIARGVASMGAAPVSPPRAHGAAREHLRDPRGRGRAGGAATPLPFARSDGRAAQAYRVKRRPRYSSSVATAPCWAQRSAHAPGRAARRALLQSC